MEKQKYLADTSAIISGVLIQFIEEHKDKKDLEIFLSKAVIAEIEHLANQKKIIGQTGLNELQKLRENASTSDITLNIVGNRPSKEDIRYAKSGEVDALIRNEVLSFNATLITADKIQADIAYIEGIDVLFKKQQVKDIPIIESYFKHSDSMSVHLSENVIPRTKRGHPGKWYIEYLSEKPLDKKEIEIISQDIIEKARSRADGFIEIDRTGCSVIQLGNMRIVISRPPFSKQREITAVRPIKILTLKDYHLNIDMSKRLERAEGILVAGSPGAGKSTFAAALAENYAKHGKIVKTVEKPRDLVVSPEITQYSALDGDVSKTADVILLVRPDYVLYDEVRDIKDFKVYSDLRLAGCGVVGVVHSSTAIDAIQRFVGKIELGIVPQIIDTVIFIKDGLIDKVLKLRMTVKVPHGMQQSDLARPVIIISDYSTGLAEYELYVFGENTVLMPISEVSEEDNTLMHKVHQIITKNAQHESKIRQTGKSRSKKPRFEITIHPKDKARVIGKRGRNIANIEDRFRCSIQIYESRKLSRVTRKSIMETSTESMQNSNNSLKEPDHEIPLKETNWDESLMYLNPSVIRIKETGVVIHFPGATDLKEIVFINEEGFELFTAQLEKNNRIFLDKKAKECVILLASLESGKAIYYKANKSD